MNIYSGCRKLNDYKGASCGQHSALSTQHSALSTQHSALSSLWTVIKVSLCIFSTLVFGSLPVFAQSYVYECGSPQFGRHSDPVSACNLMLDGTINKNEPWYSFDGCRHEVGGVLQYYYSGTGKDRAYVQECLKTLNPERYYACWINREVTFTCQYDPPRVVNSERQWLWSLNSWETSSPSLTLTPAPNQKDPRPKGTEGKDPKSSTYELIAKVMEGSTPKAGVAVTFAVEVEPNTGGHAHGDLGSIPRPKGKLSKTSGETDSNGEIKLTFIADEPAGLHAVVADCTPAGCANKATHVVKVKVPDLIHIPPDFGNAPARYVLIGNYKTPENPAQQINHNDTHFLTDQSWENLKGLIKTFTLLGWGQVGINDASLEWGGMFDIEGRWLDPVLRPNGKFTTGGHAEHRDGQQVDISFVRPASVSEALRKKVYDEACSAKEAELPRILWHKNDGYAPHFHIYLTGKGVTGAKKQCSVS